MTLAYLMATEGVRAGHKLLSVLGFGFKVEVIVTPLKDGGGAYGPDYKFIPDLREYLITVKITKNGKVWQKSIEANQFQMKSLERVILTFKKISITLEDIKVAILEHSINIQKIIISVWSKGQQ